jgi:hypothetical protein
MELLLERRLRMHVLSHCLSQILEVCFPADRGHVIHEFQIVSDKLYTGSLSSNLIHTYPRMADIYLFSVLHLSRFTSCPLYCFAAPMPLAVA